VDAPLLDNEDGPEEEEIPAPARAAQPTTGEKEMARKKSTPASGLITGEQGGYQRRRMTREELEAREAAEKQKELKYGAESVISLVMPVSLCMIVTIATIQSVPFFTTHDTQLAYTPMHESQDQTTGTRVGYALLNVVIVIAIVVCMTMLLVTLYKYRCYTAIHGWLLVVSMMLLFFMSWLYFDQLIQTHNIAFDMITEYLIIWNFGVGGLFAIHWKGPLRVQQAYHVFTSALMALILIKNLPDWTGWMLLGGIAIYDLVAVLCPGGPLAQLLEVAQERDEPLFPALIYSSTMAWITMADTGDRDVAKFSAGGGTEKASEASRVGMNATPVPGQTPQQRQPPSEEEFDEDEAGVKLGLGDFIFYSVLVGKAATTNDWGTIVACYVAIIVGLVCTLMILSIFQKALPALPISVAFGILFYFTTHGMITPMCDHLNSNLAFM